MTGHVSRNCGILFIPRLCAAQQKGEREVSQKSETTAGGSPCGLDFEFAQMENKRMVMDSGRPFIRYLFFTIFFTCVFAAKTRLTFVNGIGYGKFPDSLLASSMHQRMSSLLLSFRSFCNVKCGEAIDHIQAEQKVISDLFGGKKCEFCHNPTAKKHDQDTVGYLVDLTEAGTQKLGRNTPEVEALAK